MSLKFHVVVPLIGDGPVLQNTMKFEPRHSSLPQSKPNCRHSVNRSPPRALTLVVSSSVRRQSRLPLVVSEPLDWTTSSRCENEDSKMGFHVSRKGGLLPLKFHAVVALIGDGPALQKMMKFEPRYSSSLQFKPCRLPPVKHFPPRASSSSFLPASVVKAGLCLWSRCRLTGQRQVDARARTLRCRWCDGLWEVDSKMGSHVG